jgi:trk system potassium uptake protein TrkA
MNIVIAGAGAVGTHLARLLSKENLNVVLVDKEEERLVKLNDALDIITLTGDPTSISVLQNAGTGKADLFIAVTPDESQNITISMLAKQMGAKRTVARVDNYEYMKDENLEIFNKMGVNRLIYPELLAAKDIAASSKYSWARQTWEFGEARDLILLSVKMHDSHPIYDKEIKNENNLLVGHTLKEIGMMHGHSFHVVAIKRDGNTIVPYGDEKILTHDLVFFMTTRERVNDICHLSGKDDYPKVARAIIIGGDKLTVRTDWALPKEMSVKVVEPNYERCHQLGELLRERTMVINGEGHDMDLLGDEGIDMSEAFISLTPNDEENILACVAARRRGVKKTIAQVENLDYLEMAEQLDVGTIVNKKKIAASYIYEMLLKSSVDNMKMLTVADADVAEFVVKKNSRVTKDDVMHLGFPRGVNIGGMVRDGKGQLVSGRTVLREGDKVVVFCIGGTLKKLDRYFK